MIKWSIIGDFKNHIKLINQIRKAVKNRYFNLKRILDLKWKKKN